MVKKKDLLKPERKISREGFAWCIYLMGTNILRNLWLSILVAVGCVTVVFAPAVITGANRSILILLRGRGGLFWEDFREDFTDRFFKKLGYWLMMMLVPVAIGLWLYILGAETGLVTIVILAGLLLSLVLQTYFFTMLAALEISLSDCLKNAFLLLILEWKTSFVVLFSYAVILIIAYLTFPYSIPVLSFYLISCIMIMTCQQVRRIIIRRGLYTTEEKKYIPLDGSENTAEGDARS